MGDCRLAAVLVLLVALGAETLEAAPNPVRLRNGLSAGVLTVFSLDAQTTRSTSGGQDGVNEVLTYEQAGRLTLLVLSPPRGGRADRAWMIELDQALAEKLTRDGREIRPAPEAVELGLPPRAAQLRVDKVSPTHAFASTAGGSPIQQTALLLALDVTHWPAGPVRPSDEWEHQIDADYVVGTRTLTLDEVRGRGRAREAVVSSIVAGEFRGPLQDQATLQRVESRCVWHISDQSLLRLDATVELTYSEQETPRKLVLDLTLERLSRRELSADERQPMLDQLSELTDVIEGYLRGDRATAAEALRKFEPTYPNSIWLPVARDLLHKARYERDELETMTDQQLVSVLGQLFAHWQTIAITENFERLQPLRTTLTELAGTQRDALHKLTTSDDAYLRAMSVFCLAFGSEPDDRRAIVVACRDPHAVVRAWAVYGLAEQADPRTDTALLSDALADEDVKVRQRACLAIAACVQPSSPHAGRFAELLLEVVRTDSAQDVRAFAASALLRLARPEDLPRVVEARAAEESLIVRERLDRVLQKLGQSPPGDPD
ncbi:MAG TPA: hypothetical protein VM243_02120 [Phycisphaerae bacterium]|nr:hypothetical protein [Phycisphaerae bacterium]